MDTLRPISIIAAATLRRVITRMLDRRRDAAAPPPRASGGASIAIVLDLAREAQLAQLDQLTRLDATASGLIGFAGIMLGLLFTSDVATSYWAWPLSLSAALLAGSVLPLAYALVPRYRRRRGHPVALSPALARAVAADRDAGDLSDAVRRNARLVGYLDCADAGVVRNRNQPGD